MELSDETLTYVALGILGIAAVLSVLIVRACVRSRRGLY